MPFWILGILFSGEKCETPCNLGIVGDKKFRLNIVKKRIVDKIEWLMIWQKFAHNNPIN